MFDCCIHVGHLCWGRGCYNVVSSLTVACMLGTCVGGGVTMGGLTAVAY